MAPVKIGVANSQPISLVLKLTTLLLTKKAIKTPLITQQAKQTVKAKVLITRAIVAEALSPVVERDAVEVSVLILEALYLLDGEGINVVFLFGKHTFGNRRIKRVSRMASQHRER